MNVLCTLLEYISFDQTLPPGAQGFAYLEFLEVDAVNSAVLLDGSDLHARQIKVRYSAV